MKMKRRLWVLRSVEMITAGA